jgi:queuine tRNA-ribosyltransferase
MPIPNTLNLNHGSISLPAYLPDATFGQVRALDAADTLSCGMQAMMMNTFHLMQKPGSSTVRSLGRLNRMTGWERPIFTDSGGFQAYSLIRQNTKFGSLTDKGILFRPDRGDKKILLTPEKCIQLQMGFGSDVLFCLDDCTHIDDSHEEQVLSVARTIRWAAACRREFDRLAAEKGLSESEQPKLFAVVQGGRDITLRRQCAEELLAIGFDGYGYGGWPLDEDNRLVADMLVLLRNLIPEKFPLHALGIGHPPFIARCAAMGYSLFDSAMPTRDARHGRLYIFKEDMNGCKLAEADDWFGYLYINDEQHIKSPLPIEEECGCPVCRAYSRGYLRHLHKQNDCLYQRLATMHNLHFMNRLMKRLRGTHTDG